MMWNAVRQKLVVSARARLLTVAGLCAVVWTLAAYNLKQEARRTMQPEQVLQELDAAFRAVPVSLYNDPHHFKVADARLTVFRAPKHWVVVIKVVVKYTKPNKPVPSDPSRSSRGARPWRGYRHTGPD
jgi:hypothetical protein